MKKPLNWFPLWIDSWLFGSTRLELDLEQRSLWIDLLAIAGKDDGFIRANEGIPYPIEQLAGLLRAPCNVLNAAIERCLETGKLTRNPDGTFFVTNWEKYKLTPQYRRRLKSTPSQTLPLQKKSEERKAKKSKGERNTGSLDGTSVSKKGNTEENIQKEFDEFWQAYPGEDKGDREQALGAYSRLRKVESVETIGQAFSGYMAYLKSKRIHDHFEQSPMFPVNFLSRGQWKRFLNFEYRPPL